MSLPRPIAFLKRSLIFVHRWLGVALSILFTMWFASGIVMMYWTFPEISAEDRLQRGVTLTPEMLKVSPAEAYARLESSDPPGGIAIGSFDGRPVYEFAGGTGRREGAGRDDGDEAMVFADDGTVRGSAGSATIDRVAAAWAGRPIADATKQSVEEVDQWTVAGALRNLRPLYKYSFTDGQQVYVDGTTGDVVQYTTRASRFWAWLGAIPHWLYFTPLRQRQQEWFSFVVYSSLIGTIASLLGVIIAIWMYSPRKRYRYAGAPTSIPYKGWKRWHTIIGLVFGVFATTWAFSGLLSMGPFPILDRLSELTVPDDTRPQNVAATQTQRSGRRRGGGAAARISSALRGSGDFELAAYADRTPAEALALVREFGVKHLEYSTFAGEPVYLATDAKGNTRIVPVEGAPLDAFETGRVVEIVRSAAGIDLAEIKVIDEYDAYYLDRHREAPLPVVYARINDAGATRVYIDPKTARVVSTYNSRGWINRWLYHGLHSLDFPSLYKHRPLWDIVVIALMLGGTAICVTSLVLSWRVLVRKIAALGRDSIDRPTGDLAAEG